MQIKPSRSDIAWNYIGIIMSMASNFLLLPFLIKFIDSEMLGLWYVFLSIGGIVTLFDFGFNPTLARNVAYCWSGAGELNAEGVGLTVEANPNYRLLKKVISTCKAIYFVISVTALVVLLSIGTVYIRHVSGEIFNSTVLVSWFIYTGAVFLNLYYGYFATFLRGVGAVSTYNKINVFARLIQIFVSIGLLVLGYGIISVAVAYLLYGFLLRVFSKKAFYKYKDLGRNLKTVTEKTNFDEVKRLFRVVWHNAWKDGLVAVANYCANQAGTLIASMFLTLTETGIYSISVQLITAIATISAGLYTAYQPAMQSAYANKNQKELMRLMSLAMITYCVLFWVGTFGLITVGIPVLKWVKPENTYDIPVIMGIAIYNFFYKRQSYYASFISNTNHVPYVKAYLFSSAAGVVLSVGMVRYMKIGVWGLIIGQFLPQLVYNVWYWPREVYKMLGTTWTKMMSVGIGFFMEKIGKGVRE